MNKSKYLYAGILIINFFLLQIQIQVLLQVQRSVTSLLGNYEKKTIFEKSLRKINTAH